MPFIYVEPVKYTFTSGPTTIRYIQTHSITTLEENAKKELIKDFYPFIIINERNQVRKMSKKFKLLLWHDIVSQISLKSHLLDLQTLQSNLFNKVISLLHT